MPNPETFNGSHPSVEAVRTHSAEMHATADIRDHSKSQAAEQRSLEKLTAHEQAVKDGLQSIEPALAEGKFNAIPPQLSAKAYTDGVDVWSRGAPYINSDESRTRVINDETLRSELFELRQRFIDRSLEASDEQEARGLTGRYHSDVIQLVLGRYSDGLRPLGREYDGRLLDARARFKARLKRGRSLGIGTAYIDYHRDVFDIIQDFFAVHDKAQEAKDRGTVAAVDKAPTHVDEVSRRVVEVIKDDEPAPQPAIDPAELARALTPPPRTEVAPVADLRTVPTETPREKYQKRQSEAWKTGATAIKRQRKVSHDPVQ